MAIYKTESGVELDLTPEQAKNYNRFSKLQLIDETQTPQNNVRDIGNKPKPKPKNLNDKEEETEIDHIEIT